MPERPPKPPDKPSSPRFKLPKNKGGDSMRQALFEKLRQISKAQPTFEHLMAYHVEAAFGKSDRGPAILIATTVENALDSVLLAALKAERTDALFFSNAPLGSFYGKILIGYALDAYGHEMFENLEVIRNLRNAFAHAKQPISFATKEVADVLGLLNVPQLQPPFTVGKNKEDASHLTGLELYRFICDRIGHNLIWHAQRMCAVKIDPKASGLSVPDGYEAFLRREPLP